MNRGEVAQVLHNLLALLPPSTTSTASSSTTTTTSSSTTTTAPSGAGYENLGVAISGPLSVDAYMTGGLDVFARGADGELMSTWYDGAWSDWEYLGVTLSPGSGPASVAWETGALDVFVRGSSNQLLHRPCYAMIWSPWEDLGGSLQSEPAAASWGPNRIDVVRPRRG